MAELYTEENGCEHYSSREAVCELASMLSLEELSKVYKFVSKETGIEVINYKQFEMGVRKLPQKALLKLLGQVATQVYKGESDAN